MVVYKTTNRVGWGMTQMRVGGVTEVAAELGVSRQRMAKLRERPDFPDPLGELAQGPVWDLDAIAQWSHSSLRRSAGRPSAAATRHTLGGRFVLEEPRIGQGGFADVYRAVDKKMSGRAPSVVAVKILRDVHELDVEVIRRFRRELRLLDEELHHPHVIPVLAHGETSEDGIWYAMPLAKGSLADEIDSFVGAPGKILDLTRQVCAGLAYIHQAGVFHRDLKPANILRTAEGTWAIADFGLASEAERKTTALTSTVRAGLGTVWYTAPEQWRNAKNADQHSDIFSLGKILQELVTGEAPVDDEIPPGPFRPIIEKAIEPRPERRYHSVGELLAALERAMGARDVQWESPEDVAARLTERVRGDQPDAADLEELLRWAQQLDENDIGHMEALTTVLPRLSIEWIQALWNMDARGFRRIFERYARYIAKASFPFAFCDDLADFCVRAIRETGDNAILRMAMAALPELGESHHRWHVQSTITTILQDIRDDETALVALEGLREASPTAVEWAMSDFTLRSLHPILRNGIGEIVGDLGQSA
jgi:serine/threonine protein kinase